MKRIFVLLNVLVILILSLNVTAQSNEIVITEGPIYNMPCPNPCVTLHATYPKPLKTNSYNISSTAFVPNIITGTTITLADDVFSNAIPIGFNFCFFENTYTQCYIADNGIITFNATYANGACNTNTQQLLPYFNSTFPDLAIFGPYMDLDPNLGGTISYATIGNAPFRKFVVNYNNMRIFGSTCNTNTSTFQIVLNEGSNNVDIFITNKATCDANATNYNNYATLGLQNSGATQAFTAAGKHASVFTATNEGITMRPNGPINYNMVWRDQFNNIISTNTDSILFCPTTYPYQYITAKLDLYCPAQTIIDSVKILKPNPKIDSLQIVRPICFDDSNGMVTIYGGGLLPPFTYSKNNGIASSNNVFTNLWPGNYIFSIINAQGCKKDTFIFLAPISQPYIQIDSIKKPNCTDSNGVLYVHGILGFAPYTIVWENGDVGNICDSLPVGYIAYTITDSMGCTKTDSIYISETNLPSVNYQIKPSVCAGANGAVYITNTTGGTPPYTYFWSNGTTNDSLLNQTPGTYYLYVTDSNGCVFDTAFIILDTLSTNTYVSQTNTICNLANGAINITAFNSVSPYTYTWTGTSQTVSNINNLNAGTYICTTTSAIGCIKKDTIIILPSVAPINNISKANANCDTSNGIITLNGVTNNTGPYTTLWYNNTTGSSVNYLAPGTYWLTTTDSLGCKDSDTITLLNDGKPKLGIVSYNPPLCNGDSTGSVTLTGSSGTAPYKYSLDGINFSSFAQLFNISGGNYLIYITDANSCINDTTVFFSQPPAITLNYVSDTIDCFNDKDATMSFTSGGGSLPHKYFFNNSSTSNTITSYSNLSAGVYTVMVQDAVPCTKLFTIPVAGPSSPLQLKVEVKDVACFTTNTGSVNAQIFGGWSPLIFSWSNNATSLIQENLNAQTLQLQVTDARGCKKDTVVTLEQALCCKMVVPNAFTPNNDLSNDKLKVFDISEIEYMQFSVFNRYGNKVFTTTDVNTQWDGTHNRKDCEMGTYFYILKYKCPFSDKEILQKGDITLIR